MKIGKSRAKNRALRHTRVDRAVSRRVTIENYLTVLPKRKNLMRSKTLADMKKPKMTHLAFKISSAIAWVLTQALRD